MGAFFSSTDNADDVSGIRYSGVFGKLNQVVPETVWRFNYREKKYEVTMGDIFNLSPTNVEIADEWIEKVKTQSYAGKAHGSYLGAPGQGPRQFAGGRDVTPRPGMGFSGGTEYDAYGPFEGYGDYSGYDYYNHTYEKNGNRRGPNGHASAAKDKEAEGQILLPRQRGGKNSSKKAKGPVDNAGPGNLALEYHLENEQEIDPVGNDDLNFLDITKVEAELNYAVDVAYSLEADPRFTELTINYGPKIAVAVCMINEMARAIEDEPEIVHELVMEMSAMVEGPTRARILRSIYDRLPSREKDRISTNGL